MALSLLPGFRLWHATNWNVTIKPQTVQRTSSSSIFLTIAQWIRRAFLGTTVQHLAVVQSICYNKFLLLDNGRGGDICDVLLFLLLPFLQPLRFVLVRPKLSLLPLLCNLLHSTFLYTPAAAVVVLTFLLLTAAFGFTVTSIPAAAFFLRGGVQQVATPVMRNQTKCWYRRRWLEVVVLAKYVWNIVDCCGGGAHQLLVVVYTAICWGLIPFD